MALYRPTKIGKKSFIALLYSDTDQKNVRVTATGEVISNPENQNELIKGIKKGIYEHIELIFPKRSLEKTDNWEINGIDLDEATALVTISEKGIKNYISCELNIKQK